jgi:hypothetical protein
VPRPAARTPRLSATRAYPGHWLRAPVSPNKARPPCAASPVASYRNAYGPRSTRAQSIATDARVRVTGVVVAHDDRPRRSQADQPNLEGDAPATRASLSRDLASIAPELAPKAPLHAAHRTARVEQRTTRLALAAPDEAVHQRVINGLDPEVANGVRAADRACTEPLRACDPLAEHAESVTSRARDRYGARRCPVACPQESHGRGDTHAVWRPAVAAARSRVRTRPSRAPPTR